MRKFIDSGSRAEDTPRLSIIIATLQAAPVLARCLQSIKAQRFTDWELLVADGGSTDSTIDLIRQHEVDIVWWESASDNGIYDAWNRALGHARGEYVCFLGADDAWNDAGALARIFDAISKNEYDLVSSRGMVIHPVTGKAFEFGSAWDYRRIGRRMIVCHPGLLHRRSLFDRYGPFDSRYRIAGDLDFLMRLPADTPSLHLDAISVIIEAGGTSRRNVLARLREQRQVLASCERYGPVRAYLAWTDKLLRLPIARLLNIPH